MGRPRTAHIGTAQPKAHGSARRTSGDGRLDPVRWHRPARGTLLRLAAVAALLVTAAVVSWSPAQSCAPETGAAAVPPDVHPAAAPPSISTSPSAPSTAVPSGSVGVPVRLADPTALSLVRPGNRVDLIRVNEAGGTAQTIAAAALVLKVTGNSDPTTGGLLLALTPTEAAQAVAGTGHAFAILIRPG
jgi:hypothetical protein